MDEMTHIDKSLSNARKVYICFSIHSFDFWNNICHDNRHHGYRHKHDSHRVNKRSLYFSRKIRFAFFFGGYDFKRSSNLSGCVSHFKNCHIEYGEYFWQFCGYFIKRFTRFDRLGKVITKVFYLLFFGLK